MAKRAQTIPTTSGGLNKDVFHKFLTGINNTKQKVNDAQTAHMSEFKRADALQIHPEALKLVQKIDRMSEEKRQNLLQAFDRYRSWMTWDDQLDLLDDADEHDGVGEVMEPDAQLHDEGETGYSEDDEAADARGPAELTFASSEREEGDPMLEETQQAWDDTQALGDDEDFDKGGYTFADGKLAGSAGKPVDSNPHPAESPSHGLWARGHAVGFKDFVAAEATAVADEHEAEEGDSGSQELDAADGEQLEVPAFLRRGGAVEDAPQPGAEQEGSGTVINLFDSQDGDDEEGQDGEIHMGSELGGDRPAFPAAL